MLPRILALFSILCFADAAHAQFVKLSIPGNGCVPSEATVRLDRHRAGNGFVQHAPNNVDPIVLTCPITPFDSDASGWALTLIYRDSTGAAPSAHVQARLFRRGMNGDPPSATPVGLPGTLASSNSSPDTEINKVDVNFSHTFNFLGNIYWIQVELDRRAANQSVVFYGVILQDITPSDIRLKHSIALLGHLANGLGFYRFSYHGSDKAYVGVMAQEVEAIMPDAVMRGSDGYLGVFYDKLGLHMQSWDDWLASGATIPATTL